MGIIRVREYGQVPYFKVLDMMETSDESRIALSIEPGTLASKYIQFEKQRIEGGGYRDCIVPTHLIGLLPLNADVALWVEPKVPIGNLDYIVKKYGGIVPDSFKCLRGYMQSELDSEQLHGYIVQSFLNAVKEIRESGVLRQYVRLEDDSGTLSGSINFNRSVGKFFARGMGYRVSSRRFDKSSFIEPNICIKYALDYLAADKAINDRQLVDVFDLVSYFEFHAGIGNVTERPSFGIASMSIPQTKAAYLNAIVLAETLTAGKSIDLATESGDIAMSNVAIDMSDTFENYMRCILMEASCEGWRALDGNKLEPKIALYEQRKLLESYGGLIEDVSSSNLGNDMDPDILFELKRGGYMIADVKYKPISGSFSATRQDAEQVVTYAARIGSKHALTIHPCNEGQQSGLYYAGSIGPVDVFCYLFDLASADMASEEKHLVQAIDLLAMNDDLFG